MHADNVKAGWRREGLAGITTFLAMAYIVVVNPTILSKSAQSQRPRRRFSV